MRPENSVSKPLSGVYRHLLEKDECNRIAIPYYGAILRPGVGIEKLYFIADVDKKNSSLKRVFLEVWNSKISPELPGWLRDKGVSGLVCRDGCRSYLQPMEAAGIKVLLDKALDLAWIEGMATTSRRA
ncbi:hypothetical protein [Desulfuromonas sp. AOP6]|uniref:hypothetical protein n=1 Tax=Desulfuromonas sp. AOP6 TaxID=1566351 RepID=UPI00127D3465|nr:hypothetical protein [Desulfuromonas sp. AOP6]BCA78336.1 hypothetical protein AOP6_0123 [Desulfuromonas sp. AOP6]